MRVAAIGRWALDAVLPPTCATCEAPADAQGRFCAACFAALAFVTEPMCAVCGGPFVADAPYPARPWRAPGEGGLCDECSARPRVFRRARGALRYDEASQRLVLPLKYADRTEHAAVLAGLMLRAGRALLARAEVIVPVPLGRRRLRHRRYNQAALLARIVGRRAGLPVVSDALARTNDATVQGLDRAARQAAVAGAIHARPGRAGAIRGRSVLLVDDVMTTGATAGACAAALLAVGAAAVDVLVACRAGTA